jgi:uracil-DNA glycosylase family 4
MLPTWVNPQNKSSELKHVNDYSNKPFYSFNSPGMPPPGYDFIVHALNIYSNISTDFIYLSKNKILENIELIDKFYKDAFYSDNFVVEISIKSGKQQTRIYPGCLWGCKDKGSVVNVEPASVMIVGNCFSKDVASVSSLRHDYKVFQTGYWEFLRNKLAEVGFYDQELAKFYVTNLVKHTNLNSSARLPANFIKNCLPLLHQELRLVKPKLIVSLGVESASAILGRPVSMDSALGRIFDVDIPLHFSKEDEPVIHNSKLIIITHPSVVLINKNLITEFTEQLRSLFNNYQSLVMNKSGSLKTRNLLDLELDVVETVSDLKRVVDKVLSSENNSEIAVDLEWHGNHPCDPDAFVRTLQFSYKENYACIVVFRREGGKPVLSCHMSEVVEQLKRLFLDSNDRKVRLIGHNFKADLPWIIHKIDVELGIGMLNQFNPPDNFADTKTSGGFDTLLACHAYNEISGYSGFKLEVLCNNYLNIPRWDANILDWRKEYIKKLKSCGDKLSGYGDCPDDIMLGNRQKGIPSYAGWDAAGTYELYKKFNELLDQPIYDFFSVGPHRSLKIKDDLLEKSFVSDSAQPTSRKAFHISMQANLACLEMESNGLILDKQRAENLTYVYTNKQNKLTDELRFLLKWPDFNPLSSVQCIALLFGEKYLNKDTSIMPTGAICLELKPILATGKPRCSWEDVEKFDHLRLTRRPATDKEVLNLILARTPEDTERNCFIKKVVSILRDIRFLNSITTRVLCPPRADTFTEEPVLDGDEVVFDRGLLSFVSADGKIHTSIFQTKETGRFSTTRPPMQNLSKRREADYARILGSDYLYPLRSIFKAPDSYLIVEADYIGAELFMMAVQSGDKTMINHCQRSALPDSDPNKFDLHSFIAVKSFNLRVKSQETINKVAAKLNVSASSLGVSVGDPLPPLKLWLAANGDSRFRDVSKTIIFGIPYGRGDDAVVRAIEEEGVFIDKKQAKNVRDVILGQYTDLDQFLKDCRSRVRVGWMANWAGRFRRFPILTLKNDTHVSDLEREACNFPIQGGVADLLSIVLAKFYNYKDRLDNKGYKYQILLPVHDAIIFAVREDCLDWFIGTSSEPGVLQKLMSGTPVFRCDLDGNVIDPSHPGYCFPIEFSVSRYWGSNS